MMTQRTKHMMWVSLWACLGVIIGILVTAWFLAPSFPSHWFVFSPPPPGPFDASGKFIVGGARVSVSYSDAVITESDIPIPHVTALSGKAKFLLHSRSSGAGSPLGYIITVSIDPLDKNKLPEKYTKQKVIPTKAGPLTLFPLEQATYEVHFVFQFLDRDGFELLTANSPKHDVQSGKTTEIQAQTEPIVTSKIASLTDKITLHMVVQKCLSATPE